jgi:hypothetical protein
MGEAALSLPVRVAAPVLICDIAAAIEEEVDAPV